MTEKKSKPLLRATSFLEASVNPFTYDYSKLKFSKWQIAKIAFNTVTLLPLRLVFIAICSLVMLLASSVINIGLKPGEPVCQGWRRIGYKLVALGGRGVLFGLGFWRIKTKGRRASREEAPVFVVPLHSSHIDALCAFAMDDILPTGLHRLENTLTLFSGTIVKNVQSIVVDRADFDSKSAAAREIVKRAWDNRWPRILVFPEGVHTNRKALVTFKRGAFMPGCPVQPVVLHYRNEQDIFTWTFTGLPILHSLYLSLCQFANYLEIEYYPVYTPSEEEKQDSILYANNVRRMMAKELNVPTTDYCFEDVQLMTAGTSQSMPLLSGMVEFIKLKEKLHMRLESMKNHLTHFAEIDKNKDGYVNIEEFADYLGLPVSPQLQEVFNMYDRNGDGQVSFREYLISTALICDPANTEETLQLAFKTFDVNGDGFVDRCELEQILSAMFDGVVDEYVDGLMSDSSLSQQGAMSYDEFVQVCKKRPEYAVLFRQYEDKLDEVEEDQEAETDNGSRHIKSE